MVQTTSGKVLKVVPTKAELDPWPISQELILSGNPDPKGKFLWQSDDKKLGNGVWTCQTGSFNWDYTWDETIYFLEGEATITNVETGEGDTYRGGDMFFVPTGVKSKWVVTKPVRKVFHLRSDTPV